MERLTQKSINYCAEICRAQDCETYHGVRNDVCGDAAIYNRLAAYEDLEEQGRLIVLPCKVGDTVYLIDYNTEACDRCFSHYEADYDMYEDCREDYDLYPDDDCNNVCPKHFKEVIAKKYSTYSWPKEGEFYFTREEAEKALKGVSEDA